jgi:two-component system OmpR family sensor kinase
MAARGSWSLRRRLVVGIVALLAVVSVVVGASSAIALRQTLLDRLDGQVLDAVARLGGLPVGFGSPQGEVAVPPGDRIGTLVVTAQSAQYIAEDGTGIRLSDAQVADLRALDLASGELATVRLDGVGEFRVAARTTPGGDTVLAGLPTAEVSATIGNLVLIFSLVTALALAVAALAGTQVVRVALRPLGRVTATARRVAVLPLDRGQVALAERVPDSDPRTEVGQVGAALNLLLEHVESSLRARQESEEKVRQFVADASHELRTPLASIRGYAELTRRTGIELPDDIAYALARIESESVRMTSLVEELLLLARLDAGQDLVRGAVDLVPLVADAVSDAHAAGPDHAWRVEVGDEPVLVDGDAGRLHQVVANLLANARVHTPAGSTVTASLGVDGGDAVLTVADDGPGIPAALRPTLFERFARGDASRSRATGSTGLGLAIVAAVVEAHRGSVRVEGGAGDTRFVVRLPLVTPSR